MTKLVADSSVFISYFGNDNFTPDTKLFFSRLDPKTTELVLPSLVIAETLTILSRLEPDRTKDIFNPLQFSKSIPLDHNFLNQLVDHLSIHPSPLKSSDTIIALTAKLQSATLITWDKRLLDNSFCSTLTPNQYIISQ